jgi:hypothetical protein
MRTLPGLALAAALLAPMAAFGQGTPSLQGAAADVEVTPLVRAIVETVDMRSRQVLLRHENGTLQTYTAGPEVRNLAQVRPGDAVDVDLVDAVALTWLRGGEQVQPGQADATVRAAPGERPGAGVATTTRLVATVEEIDVQGRRVLLRGASGRAHRVLLPPRVDPSQVRIGDQVVVDLTEGMLIRVRPR